MTGYQINTIFRFGKHKGKTLLLVAKEDPGYLNWCAETLDNFHMTAETLSTLKSHVPILLFTPLAMQRMVLHDVINPSNHNHDVHDDDDHWDDDEEDYYDPMDDYGSSYVKYGGYNGFSDDAIDDAFDGDPMATWNVD